MTDPSIKFSCVHLRLVAIHHTLLFLYFYKVKKNVVKYLFFLICTQFCIASTAFAQSDAAVKPSLFARLDSSCATPDGMAIDRQGNLYVSVTNPTTFEKNGAKILKFDRNDRPVVWCDTLPVHPVSKQVHPMGMTFDENGNLYVVDNQFFSGIGNSSRILKLEVKGEKIVNISTVISGLNFANGIKYRNKQLFVTDSWTDNKNHSAVYRFPLADFAQKPLELDSLSRPRFVLHTFVLADSVGEEVGADGLTFDDKGNLYVGSFADGSITRFTFNKKGEVKSVKVICHKADLKCCDGMYFDRKRNALFIANFLNNSIHILDLNTLEMKTLWENNNDKGETGLLDNPCEVIYYKGKLLVVNFDTFSNNKNTEVDTVNTISQFVLK